MTRTIAALLAAATIAGVAAPAAAQTKYFAREKIVGIRSDASSPPAATPKWRCATPVKAMTLYDAVNTRFVAYATSLEDSVRVCESAAGTVGQCWTNQTSNPAKWSTYVSDSGSTITSVATSYASDCTKR